MPIDVPIQYDDPEYYVSPDLVRNRLNVEFRNPRDKKTLVRFTFQNPEGIMNMITLFYEGVEVVWPDFAKWMKEEQKKAGNDS